MKKSSKFYFIITSLFLSVFTAFTVIVSFVDVKTIGPNQSSVGLSCINKPIFKFFKENTFWDMLSDILLVIALLTAILFVVIGVIQFIKRKSIFAVDSEILALSILYITTIIVFIIFELLVINYRPVLVDGKLEASYPSTHILVVLSILLSTAMIIKKFIKKDTIRIILQSTLLLLSIFTIVARIVSGIHWFTDIIGAILLSLTLLSFFKSLLVSCCTDSENTKIIEKEKQEEV